MEHEYEVRFAKICVPSDERAIGSLGHNPEEVPGFWDALQLALTYVLER